MPTEKEHNLRVLVVADETYFRQTIVDILKAVDVDTLEAETRADIARLLGQNEIGLVLTEYEMPDESGLQILYHVKSFQPDVPVVVISGRRDFDAAREALSGGALDYLVKPFPDKELLDVVKRGLSQYRTNQEAKRNRDAAERLLADLVLLREIGESASGMIDLESFLDRIIDKAVAAVEVKTASLMLPDEDGNLRIRAVRGLPEGVQDKTVVQPGEGLSGHVFASGKPVLLADIREDGRFTPAGRTGQYSTSSALSLPLKGRDGIIGVLNVNNKVNDEPFSATDQTILSSICHQASLAIENFRLVNELRTKAIELEALNSSRSRLACNLSHELKTPLTTVLGFSDLLQTHRTRFKAGEIDEYLKKITEASLQMEKLISGMLLLFSLDSDDAVWSSQAFSVADLCREELEHFSATIEQKGLHTEIEFGESLPPLEADREKVRLLIEALIDNAVKFNSTGGKLGLRVEAMHRNNSQYLYLRIYNDGAHVPVESAAEVFARYSQLGEINTAKPRGVGIGLALCRTIVDRMDGEIFLEETGGTGTCFGLFLPVRTKTENER